MATATPRIRSSSEDPAHQRAPLRSNLWFQVRLAKSHQLPLATFILLTVAQTKATDFIPAPSFAIKHILLALKKLKMWRKLNNSGSKSKKLRNTKIVVDLLSIPALLWSCCAIWMKRFRR